jgi:hypothetical protein
MSAIYRSFLLAVLLLAACQSSRPAFYFGSRPHRASAGTAAATVAAIPDSALVASSGAAAAAAGGSPSVAERRRSRHQSTRSAPTRRRPISAVARVVGRASRAVEPGVVQQKHPRNATDFDHGKALGQTILAALYVVGLVVLLIVLLSAHTATGQLVWGIAFGVAALPLLYWLGKVFVELIRPARNTPQHLSWRIPLRIAAVHPADGIDALGRFFVKVTVVAASVFLLTLVLGLVIGSTAATVIGAIGLALLAVLALALLNA